MRRGRDREDRRECGCLQYDGIRNESTDPEMPVLQAMFAGDPGDEEIRAMVHGWRVWRDEDE